MNEEQNKNILRNIAIWKEIAYRLDTVAALRDPEKLANVVYFLKKQFPNNEIFNAKYEDFLYKMEESCVDVFGWEEAEVHQAFCILNILTQYSKKRLDIS